MPTVSPARAAKYFILVLIALLMAIAGAACVKGQPAIDTGDPGFPFGPTSITVQPLAYIPDVKPILDRDCSECHGGDGRGDEEEGGYSVRTYTDVMAGQTPGDAKSSLVRTSSPGGSMYGYFTGDATTSATIIFRWMVYYNAAHTR